MWYSSIGPTSAIYRAKNHWFLLTAPLFTHPKINLVLLCHEIVLGALVAWLFSSLQHFTMLFSILNVSLPHCHLSEVPLSFIKRSFVLVVPARRGAGAVHVTCSVLVTFCSANLCLRRSVTSELVSTFSFKSRGRGGSPIRNTLIIPNWELLQQISYFSINLPILGLVNICCVNTLWWES